MIPDQRGTGEMAPPVPAVQREMEIAAKIGREFPGWKAWVALDGRWRARPLDVHTVVIGEDEDDLRDMINAWIRNHP